MFDVCVSDLWFVRVLIRFDFLILDWLVKYILIWFVGGRLFIVIIFFRNLIGCVNSLCFFLNDVLFGVFVNVKLIFIMGFIVGVVL